MKTVTVTKIIDGDTLIIHDGNESLTARIINIDAPELRQEHGRACKEWLEEILLNRTISVKFLGRDKYRRHLIHWKEGELGIDELLVSIGHAWEYTKYNVNKSLEKVQNDAIKVGIGIWNSAMPVPPWIWRKLQSPSKRITA